MICCFSFVDNFDGKFVKAVIELHFTGAFVTNGWLPNILVNMKAMLKKSLKFPLRMNEATTLVTSFLSSHQMPGY